MTGTRVAIVGGGILGLTAAYRLARESVDVELFERSPDLGGLVGSFDFAGTRVDRFYHVVLPTDDRVRGLAAELGLGDEFRFRPTGVGFYHEGRLCSMNSLREFATFPLLSPPDRLRLALFVARCRATRSHEELDDVSLVEWLERQCGRRVVERLWRPLLDSKFDGRYDDLPATYIWARTRRMAGTRDRAGHEIAGWLDGGYQRLIDALAERATALGARIHAATEIEQIAGTEAGAEGLVIGGRLRRYDCVLCTLAPPQTRRLLAPGLAAAVPEASCRYLGVVCLLLRVRRSISPYYTLNITDRSVPLTTIVETTHVVDPDRVGGTLIYVAKYLDPGSPVFAQPPGEIEREYLAHARRVFPALRADDVLAQVVQRARIVEPVHLLGGARALPPLFPRPGLALASTANVYPDNVNGQSVLGVAERVVAGLLERLACTQREAA